jgi:hypothetical protein
MDTEEKKLSVVCAWCESHQSGPEPDDPAKISHTICPDCLNGCFGGLFDMNSATTDDRPVRVPARYYGEAFRAHDRLQACPECWEQYRCPDGYSCPACHARGERVRLVPEWEV